jgi:hypothetical protein
MTTHQLAKELLTHPDLPIHVQGWTSEDIQIIRPLWCDTHREVRMLSNPDFNMTAIGDTEDLPPMKWINPQ